MTADSTWREARRVLCVRLDNMGDVLMTTPALRALKVVDPSRHLTLLASRSGAALAPHLPDVDEVITYDAPWVKGDGHDLAADREMIEQLRAGDFDAAVIFTVYSQSPLPAALLCRLAGIPLVLAHCRENPYSLLTDWVRETEPAEPPRHEAQRQLDLVAYTGARISDERLRFAVRKEDRASLYSKLAQFGVGGCGSWVVAHCGASAPSRRYPVESYAQVFQLLGDRAGPILMTGDASEKALTRELGERCGPLVQAVDLAGRLTLGELACLIDDAALLLSNNTGPVHLAAALGTPVVDLYALTNPQHTPWQVPQRVLFHDVPCRYCYRSVCPELHHQCLRGVTPQAVCEAVLDLLAETRRPSSRPLADVY